MMASLPTNCDRHVEDENDNATVVQDVRISLPGAPGIVNCRGRSRDEPPAIATRSTVRVSSRFKTKFASPNSRPTSALVVACRRTIAMSEDQGNAERCISDPGGAPRPASNSAIFFLG
jgi:hypothetical protein